MFPTTLSQPQREGAFDLLLLGMYADNNLRLAENERLYRLIRGHPFLARKALYMAAGSTPTCSPDDLFAHARDDGGPFGDHFGHGRRGDRARGVQYGGRCLLLRSLDPRFRGGDSRFFHGGDCRFSRGGDGRFSRGGGFRFLGRFGHGFRPGALPGRERCHRLIGYLGYRRGLEGGRRRGGH